MSVSIHIQNAVKKFGDKIVIPDLNAHVKQGEFFTLLGPSGCGKTTLLRMIAGFNSIEGGTIRFNDLVVNQIPPHKRNIGMVFQNYAIFPHMTTAQNVEFGLKNRKVKRDEINRKIDEILKIVQIHDLKDRLPSNMSGGQQQRIALARAIVIQPDVLLMDEPLSNLDAKLRIEMRTAIKDIQAQFKITTVYVTHDQEEALAISDRIAVMREGVIQQIGSPIDIYQRPYNLYVATFIGKSNFLEATVNGQQSIQLENGMRISIPTLRKDAKVGQKVKLLVRPNEFTFDEQSPFIGKVVSSTFLGSHIEYRIEWLNKQILEVHIQDLSLPIVPIGESIKLGIKPAVFNVFDAETELSMIEGVKQGD